MDEKEQKMDSFLRNRAARFQYPETPDLLARGSHAVPTEPKIRRRAFPKSLVYALAIALALLVTAWSVPQVRAAVSSWLRLGAIGIDLEGQSTPAVPPTPLPSLRDLSGPMALEEAEELAGFALPTSDNMGPPQYAFFQQLGGPAIVSFWSEGEAVTISLIVLRSNAWVTKTLPDHIEELEIDGRRALWLEGEHELILQAGPDFDNFSLFVESNVLIWEIPPLTYRLEGDFGKEKAIEIMDSLFP